VADPLGAQAQELRPPSVGGNLIGGTCISAPGGGHVEATEAELYLFDFAAREVVYREVPVPGATQIKALLALADGRVLGLTSTGHYFVFDVASREIIHREDWSGRAPGRGIGMGPDGRPWVSMASALIRLAPDGMSHEEPIPAPAEVRTQVVPLGDRLYFAGRSHLWSYGPIR